MKHAFSILQYNGLSESLLKKILPEHFEIRVSDKGRWLIIINSQAPISGQEIMNEIQRELDRISFLLDTQFVLKKSGKKMIMQELITPQLVCGLILWVKSPTL